MEIFRHIDDRGLSVRASVATLGNFDGIHLGHQALIQSTVEDARRLGIVSVILTFEPHPLKILAPARAPKLILAHKDKMQLLQLFGMDVVVVQNFDTSFANIEAEEFVRRFLVERLKIKKVWVGKDLRFGRGRKGGVNDLISWAGAIGFDVGIVEPVMVKGIRVSSSRIRQLLAEGRVEEVEPMLGRYHFVSGRVVRGHHRGRELGFPTANISPRTEVLPPDGIYATLFQFGDKKFLSVSNIGVNPTFGEGPRTVETFILDFNDDVYGRSVRLSFVKRIREEKKFASVDQLIEQMKIDVACARAIFNQLGMTENVAFANKSL
jgi:riboflavin kinase/FMN adenylyltransferase